MITPHLNPNFISIGPISIKWYGMMYLLGIIGGYLLIKKDLYQRLNFNFDELLNNAFYIMLGIILGGRIGYVLLYDLPYYFHHPFESMAIWHGGMSYHGGAIGCVIALIIYAKINKKNIWILLDLLGIGSTIGLGLGRIGNFINGELYGRVTQVPWGMIFPLAPDHFARHPSQLYEAFLEGLVLLLILWFIKKYLRLHDGQLFAIYLCLYGIFRTCLEFFREPDPQLGLFFGIISMGQLLCFLMITLGIILWIYCSTKPHERTNR